MTFNLLGAQGDAYVVSEHAGWAARIDQLSPDVLVVQEAQHDDVRALLDLTSTEYSLATYLQWECDLKTSREGVAILVRSTLSTASAGGTHVGESCFDPSVRRVLVWVDLVLESGPFRVYGTHLTAGGGASGQSRDAQIRAIRQLVLGADTDDERRWVLAGDMNAHPGSTSYELLTEGSADSPAPYPFVDTFAEWSPDSADPEVCPAVAASDLDAMQFLWANPEHVRRCGYTGGWPKDDNWLACDVLSFCVSWEERRDTSVRVRIDHVLRPGGGPARLSNAFVPSRSDPDWAVPGAEWFRLSDHLPVVSDLVMASTDTDK
jgi:endonuclease/exonuclease/phosphatase family metal-dependent hydrolase